MRGLARDTLVADPLTSAHPSSTWLHVCDIIPACYTGHPASHPDAMYTSRSVYYRKYCSL